MPDYPADDCDMDEEKEEEKCYSLCKMHTCGFLNPLQLMDILKQHTVQAHTHTFFSRLTDTS